MDDREGWRERITEFRADDDNDDLKQFSFAWVHSLIVNRFLFQATPFSQTVLIQTIQFSVSLVSMLKTVLVRLVLFNP